MNNFSAHTAIFPFQEYGFHAGNVPPTVLKEETIFSEHSYGTSHLHYWLFDGIQLTHASNVFHDHYTFKKENADDVVHLSFNLKGRVLIEHLGTAYRVQSRQHNMIYSPSFSNTFKNLDRELETFPFSLLRLHS